MHNMEFKIKDKNQYIGERVEEGDIIKIGRVKLQMRKFNLHYQPHNRQNHQNITDINPKINSKVIEKEQFLRKGGIKAKNEVKEVLKESEEIPPCRFCLINEMDDQNNPLINPCHCKGTMGYLHIECLKYWLNTKRTVKEYNGGS